MATIAFVSSKGGVGKTTSALLLGLGLDGLGRRVALVDADPNLPITAWAEKSGAPARISVVQAPHFADLPGALRSARREAEIVIVDTEGGAPRLGGHAMAAADLVIAPLSASPLEAREAVKAAALTRETSRREGRPILAAALFARTPGGRRRAFEIIAAELAAADMPLLSTVLSDREVFRSIFRTGGGLSLLGSRAAGGGPSTRLLVEAFAREIDAIVSPAPP